MAQMTIDGEYLGVHRSEFTDRETGEITRRTQVVLLNGYDTSRITVPVEQVRAVTGEVEGLPRLTPVRCVVEVGAWSGQRGAALTMRLVSLEVQPAS